MENKEKLIRTKWNTLSQEQKDKIISEYVIDFSSIPYERRIEERALYPFSHLNYMTGGMELGEMSVIAGETGGGKSTLISQIVGQVLDDNDKVFCIYGESTLQKQANNTYRQYVPYKPNRYQYVQFKKNGNSTNISQYFVDEEGEQIVKRKTKSKLFYYKTTLGMTVPIILDVIDYVRRKLGIKYMVIDNIMQLQTNTENEVKEVKDAIELFRQYVIDNLVHICFIAHYRKGMESGQIRRKLEEICGTSAIPNKMATAINIIRLDNLYKGSKQFKELAKISNLNNQPILKEDAEKNANVKAPNNDASALLEVLKTRWNRLGWCALGYSKMSNTYYELYKYNKDADNDKEPILQNNQDEMTLVSKEEQERIDKVFSNDDGTLPY